MDIPSTLRTDGRVSAMKKKTYRHLFIDTGQSTCPRCFMVSLFRVVIIIRKKFGIDQCRNTLEHEMELLRRFYVPINRFIRH